MATHLYTYTNPTAEKHLQQTVDVLDAGGLIAYPTDVNWAIGWAADNKKAAEKARRLKPNHPKDQPFTILFSSIEMLSRYAHYESYCYRILKRCLPGPYTFLFKASKELQKTFKDKRSSVGTRIPDCPLLIDLIEYYGKPLANTSLNSVFEDDREPIRYGYEINDVLGNQLDLILDLGEEVTPGETTIVDLSQGEQSGEIIRVGQGEIEIFLNHGFTLP